MGIYKKRSVLGNSRFIYAQSSLRLHHINYFNHVLELFKPYLSNNLIYKEKTFTDKRTNKEYKSVLACALLHYPYLVLITIEICFMIQIT